MKRMYVTLFIIFSLLLVTLASIGSEADRVQKRMEMRAEMHRRMMDKIINGIGSDDDLFKDMEQMFEQSMQESMRDMQSLSLDLQGTEHFKSYWEETPAGKTFVIIPQTPGQKLDINVQNQMITIKGESELKSQMGIRTSQFTTSVSVPPECDDKKVKILQKDGKLMIELPYIQRRPIKGIPDGPVI